ncbi:hypothetical protein [Oceanithermus sp.]|uniref:Uncharacterized protein n=1 Tax=Oceanithermus profundus TaxID=187137 RepID=A0A7C5SS84_9DEIN|nr:hypothetical protein [Oceanithermus sp.]HHO57561.1 hypothetical protein [Oceanithermus profundus]
MSPLLLWLLVVSGLPVSYALSAPRRLFDPIQIVLVVTAYVFGLSLAWFASGSGAVAWTAGVLLGALIGRWNRRLVIGGIGLGAAEQLAFKLAWRHGGAVEPADLIAAGVDPDTARATLENLEARGLCRRDGEQYRFER